MTFLEGAFLAGALAALVPIALHLLDRRRVRRLPFPSLRFLREARARTARRSRIEEWAVLLLRVGAIGLLSVALARPVLRSVSSGTGATSRVIIVDNSMSMDARLAGSSALDRALAVARGIVARSGGADRTAALPLHGDPWPLTESRVDLDRALAAVRPTHRDSPIVERIEEAARILDGDPNPRKEIHLLSDLQASALRGLEGPLAARVPEGVRLVLLRPLSDPGPNVAIAGVEACDGERSARVRVRSSGGPALARLELSVDGKPVAERSLGVEAGAEATALFRLPVLAPGLHRVEARTRGDVLPADDALEIAVEPRGEIRAVVARDPPEGPGGRDPAYFVSLGLLAGGGIDVRVASTADLAGLRPPGGSGIERAGLSGRLDGVDASIRMDGVDRPARLDDVDRAVRLDDVDVVFLIEPGRLDPAVGEALARFVIGGGGLFVATGPRGDERALDALALTSDLASALASDLAPGVAPDLAPGVPSGGAGLSPARLGPVVRAEGAPLHIATWDERHPVWAPLLAASPPLRPGVPSFAAIRKASPQGGAEILASFTGGHPALILGRSGKGAVLLFASTVTDAWGDLPLRYLFAPWMHAIARYLAPAPARSEVVAPGTRLVVRHPAGSGFSRAALEPPGEPVRTVPATLGAPLEGAAPSAPSGGPDGAGPSRTGVSRMDVPGIGVPGMDVSRVGVSGRLEGAAPSAPSGGPDGAGPSRMGASALVADLGTLERPGVHVLTETLREGSRRRAIVVAPAAAEGDLEPLADEERERIFPGAAVVPFRDASEGIAGAAAATIGSEYKSHLLVILLLALLLEPLVANRSALRRSGDPRGARAGERNEDRGTGGRSP